jgi:hypothetical protein
MSVPRVTCAGVFLPFWELSPYCLIHHITFLEDYIADVSVSVGLVSLSSLNIIFWELTGLRCGGLGAGHSLGGMDPFYCDPLAQGWGPPQII